MKARMGRDAAGGSMRSTTARPDARIAVSRYQESRFGNDFSVTEKSILVQYAVSEAPKRFDDQKRRTNKESSYDVNAGQVSRTVGPSEDLIG